MGYINSNIENRLRKIKLLLLDVDGVLTDGSIIYNDSSEETKVFNVKDGLGIRLLMEAGINVCIVSGRSSKALYHRCQNLGIKMLFDRIRDKVAALNIISKQTGVSPEEIAFIGDDLPDLPLMRIVELPIAVANAHEAVLREACMVTSAKGGDGAVREVCEAILKVQELWEKIPLVAEWLKN